MPKLVSMPPQNDRYRAIAARLQSDVPDLRVVVAETQEDARRELPDADAVFGRIPPELLPLATNVRWLQAPAAAPPAGFYYEALAEHPLIACNMRGIFDDHISHLILLYVLALGRGLPYYMEAQRERRWDEDARKHGYVDLGQATALIVGVGGIGHETARLCHEFGLRVIGVDQRWEYDPPHVERHDPEDLDSLLPKADFVIVTTPHTPQTEGMWNRQRFALMKPEAYFINIGRGLTTRLDDLVAALSDGQIAGCALDVFEIEPLPADHPLWTMPNVILTPHIASYQAESVNERYYGVLVDNARRFVAGKPLRNVVDKALWF
ncbi:MAG: D-2-hydroxyacid dehydrogenase [Caldilineaceae bacterium]|jgi:phosphoglycerate dehydrogenase-like enzyme